jgi:hypothetical protein
VECIKNKMKSLIETITKIMPTVEEDNVTGGGEFYATPNAFRKKIRKPDDESYSELIEDMIERSINEISYKTYKTDDSLTERQKINNNIIQINKMLGEVEQMINHATKLKLESGSDQSVFWKGTLGKFQKIDQRLGRVSSKLREFNT